MPYKDKEQQKKYVRNYMAKRRAAYKDLQRRVSELEKIIGNPKRRR